MRGHKTERQQAVVRTEHTIQFGVDATASLITNLLSKMPGHAHMTAGFTDADGDIVLRFVDESRGTALPTKEAPK